MRTIIKQFLLSICLIGIPTSVNALPFKQDPKSFERFVNSRTWNGSKVIFQNLNMCRNDKEVILPGDGYPLIEARYVCSGGFVQITDPRGTQICIINSVDYRVREYRTSYSTREGSCRYK